MKKTTDSTITGCQWWRPQTAGVLHYRTTESLCLKSQDASEEDQTAGVLHYRMPMRQITDNCCFLFVFYITGCQ